ncbi:MAG: putative metal-binding motif-containing protein [Sandaracinaceae bacterium]
MRLRLSHLYALFTVAALGGGCSVIVDGTLTGKAVDCADAADGTECDVGLICVDGDCVESDCGDGYIDAADGEECDDGNDEPGDGCGESCTFDCVADEDCAVEDVCLGEGRCDLDSHTCQLGDPPADGTACATAAVPDGVCRTAECVPPGCGNGVVDAGEDCDDMNEVDSDGCRTDCSYTCTDDAMCDDGVMCSGLETCDLSTHTCQPGTPTDCNDDDPCTDDLCDDLMGGCFNPLIDMDGDGHAPSELGACGDDCDDTREDIFTGAPELCDGLDNDCDAAIDEDAPSWYVDCDEDGYAVDVGTSRVSCEAPPSSVTGCGGGWTTRRPVGASTTDCDDSVASMNPGQRSYFTSPHPCSGCSGDDRWANYDCNGSVSRELSTATGADASDSCDYSPSQTITLPGSPPIRLSERCSGSTGWTGSSAPSCGGSGNFTSCNAPQVCSGSTSLACRGYTLECRDATSPMCECSRPPCCTPGSRDCPWAYVRCTRSTRTERQACR